VADVSEAHYRFPPAGAYALNRILFALKSDTEARRRFLADRERAARAAGLSDAESQALVALDRDALVGLGAHPYLVFMADLRLHMDGGTGRFEYF
jgi:hypothetical protein